MDIKSTFDYNSQKETVNATGNIVRKLVATVMQFGADNTVRTEGILLAMPCIRYFMLIQSLKN